MNFLFSTVGCNIAANVLPLAAVGDFGALHCQPSTNVDRSTALDLTTSAPIAANGSYVCILVILQLIKRKYLERTKEQNKILKPLKHRAFLT